MPATPSKDSCSSANQKAPERGGESGPEDGSPTTKLAEANAQILALKQRVAELEENKRSWEQEKRIMRQEHKTKRSSLNKEIRELSNLANMRAGLPPINTNQPTDDIENSSSDDDSTNFRYPLRSSKKPRLVEPSLDNVTDAPPRLEDILSTLPSPPFTSLNKTNRLSLSLEERMSALGPPPFSTSNQIIELPLTLVEKVPALSHSLLATQPSTTPAMLNLPPLTTIGPTKISYTRSRSNSIETTSAVYIPATRRTLDFYPSQKRSAADMEAHERDKATYNVVKAGHIRKKLRKNDDGPDDANNGGSNGNELANPNDRGHQGGGFGGDDRVGQILQPKTFLGGKAKRYPRRCKQKKRDRLRQLA
ncbi:hypothetical protein N0V90_001051 [Kalmusia sp. IMI 367209]|nr:hypothetical protein N0V90_001051 [Kalmusia sp. IMI 367209]